MKYLDYLLRNYYSQSEIAKLMGYKSRSTVSMWITKGRIPVEARAWLKKRAQVLRRRA